MFGRTDRNPFTRSQVLCRLMSRDGVTVRVGLPGQTPVTDGKTITLPPIPLCADELEVMIHEMAISHEPAHITEGSFDFPITVKSQLHHHVWNVVEDVRVESLQESVKYPGLKVFRSKFYRDFQTVADRLGLRKMVASDLSGAVMGALTLLLLNARGKQLHETVEVRTSKKVEEIYARVLADVVDDVAGVKTLRQSLDLAGVIYERIRNMLKEDAEKKQREQAAKEKAKKEKAEKKQKAKQEEQEKGDTEDSEEDGDAEGSKGDTEDSEEDGDAEGSKGGTKDSDEDGKPEGKAAGADEDVPNNDDNEEGLTDEQQQAANDEVESLLKDIEEQGTQTVSDQIKQKIGGGDEALKKTKNYPKTATVVVHTSINPQASAALAAAGVALLGAHGANMTRLMIANSRPRTLRNREHGKLDVRAVVGDDLDVRRDLWAQRKPGALAKAAVSILVDGSGSMTEKGSTKAHYSALVLHGIAHHLAAARVPFEVAYFDTIHDGVRNHAYYHTVKSWVEPWHGKPFTRVWPRGKGGTPLEVAMTEQAMRLIERPEDKKIAIVLTDGRPDRGPEHSRLVVDALRGVGVVVVGIGIECDVSDVFGTEAVNLAPANLGEHLVTRLTEILNAHAAEKSETIARVR